MISSELLINNRPYTLVSSLSDELNLESDKNYLFELSYLSILTVAGERAREFLQGQVSCDVNRVNSETIQQGAMCNLKGRVLALFDLIEYQGLKLVLPDDLLAGTKSSLNQVALLSRATLDRDDSYMIYGFYLSNQNDLMPLNIKLPANCLSLQTNAEACCYKINKHFYIILIKKEQSGEFSAPFVANEQFRGSLAWHQQQLLVKNIQIYPLSRGLFLPHRIDLHLSGYLSFDKGCYKGQEIVARTHYRAKLKHALKLFIVENDAPLLAGKKIFDSSGQVEIGELIDFCPLGNKQYLIAVSILNDHPENILIESQEKSIFLKAL